MAMAFGENQQRCRAFARRQGGESPVNRNPLVGPAIYDRRLLVRSAKMARLGTPLPIEVAPRCDPPQPSGEAALAAPLVQRAPGGKHGILGDIVAFVADQPPRITAQRGFMGAHQRAKGGEVSPRRPANQLALLGRCQDSAWRLTASRRRSSSAPPTNSGNIDRATRSRKSFPPLIAAAAISARPSAMSTKPMR